MLTNCIIKMINNAFPFNDKWFVCKVFIVRFCWTNKVGTGPIGPVDQVIRAGESFIGMLVTMPEGAEIKHHVQLPDLSDLCITTDRTILIPADHGIFPYRFQVTISSETAMPMLS